MNISTEEWKQFTSDITTFYEELKSNDNGKLADYIPQLANVDSNLFAISITTINNQTFNIGDFSKHFCIQSCCKPLNYALALQEHGEDTVSKHIGIEPSGSAFNSFLFDKSNKPFNALINAGAIMSTSLIKSNDTQDKRFDFIIEKWKSIIGDNNIGFDNSVYLSEKRTAHRNYALAHLMMENNIFPKNSTIENTLELYLQSCSISMNTEGLSKFAAMLANGGQTVDTHKQILPSSIVKNILCVMYSSGMYDYSGRWGHYVGLPAKSGVSGSIFVVIPNFGGICVYSPKLDQIGNSVRGVEFFHKLIKNYKLHIFDTLVNGLEKKKSIGNSISTLNKLCDACSKNNLDKVKSILSNNSFDINTGDYDNRRALHIATDDKNYECIKLLIEHKADFNVQDRWGMTPLQKAIEYNDETILSLFNYKKEE